MIKWAMRAGVLAAIALAIGACGGDDDDGGDGSGGGTRTGGSITLSQTSQPDFLDPSLGYTVNAIEPFWLVYTPPLTYPRKEGDAGAQLVPGLSEAMPKISEDGLTYDFTFRKGLKYSDGTPLKASDFEHSIRRVLNLESGGSAFYLVIEGAQDFIDAGKCDGDISGIETDDKTGRVTIRLTEPDGAFQHVLAMWFSAPVPGDTPCRNLTKEPPPGIGPYTFTESVPNRQFVMEKNKNFPDLGADIPPGKVDTITTKIVKSAARQTQDVISGELDYMQDPPPADLKPEVRAEYSDRYEEITTSSTYYFFMNTRVPPRRGLHPAQHGGRVARGRHPLQERCQQRRDRGGIAGVGELFDGGAQQTPILAERLGIHQARAAQWARAAGATYSGYVELRA